MTIHLHCGSCNAGLKVPDRFAGKTGKCPKCGAKMHIPAAEPAAELPAPEPRPPAEPAIQPQPAAVTNEPADGLPRPTAFSAGLDLSAGVGLADESIEHGQLDAPEAQAGEQAHRPDPASHRASREPRRGKSHRKGHASRKPGRGWLWATLVGLAVSIGLIVGGVAVHDTTARASMIGSGVALAYLTLIVVMIAGVWGMLAKAGKPGWGALVPIYNGWLICETAHRPGWWTFLTMIPFVGIVFAIMIVISLARAFGRGAGTVVGLIFLPIVFVPVLGLGAAEWQPPAPAPERSPRRAPPTVEPQPQPEPERPSHRQRGGGKAKRGRRRR